MKQVCELKKKVLQNIQHGFILFFSNQHGDQTRCSPLIIQIPCPSSEIFLVPGMKCEAEQRQGRVLGCGRTHVTCPCLRNTELALMPQMGVCSSRRSESCLFPPCLAVEGDSASLSKAVKWEEWALDQVCGVWKPVGRLGPSVIRYLQDFQ